MSPQEVNHRLSEPVVGQVPDLHSFGKNGRSTPLLQPDDDRHAYAESFRSLRSALMFMTSTEERPRTILITSAIPNEGKSTVAANLARTLALGGAKVVLIDGDLRKGVLHHVLGLKREPGLGEILRSPESLDQCIQNDAALRFSFIGSGSVSRNTGDLLLGPGFDQLLARLRVQFDYVLIDSSPVFAADDASTLAPKVDGTLFVVRNGYSGAKLVREALHLLYQRQARVLGVVFNRTNASSRSYYYYKYADYYPDPAGKAAV
jgi:capsular exopolysaccharide synthesis family protein